jgi:hypothetical protein
MLQFGEGDRDPETIPAGGASISGTETRRRRLSVGAEIPNATKMVQRMDNSLTLERFVVLTVDKPV